MTEKNLKIDEILEELHTLRDENYFLRKQNSALKMRCSKYSLQISDLETEIKDIKFARNFKTMTPEELDIAKFEDNYVPYTAEDF